MELILSALRLLRAEERRRPLLTRIVPLRRPFLDDMVTIPRLEFLTREAFRLARCDIVAPLFFIEALPGLTSGSYEGDFASFILDPVEVGLARKFFLESDFFTWKARGEWLYWLPAYGR